MKKDPSKIKMDRVKQTKSLGVFFTTRNMIKENWYFDTECSQHMIGNFLGDLIQPSMSFRTGVGGGP